VKLVLFDENFTVRQVIEEIEHPVINENNVTWEGGSLNGINLPFVLLQDDVEIGETISEEAIAQDQKTNYLAHDLVTENEQLKARVEAAEAAIISLMDFV
jgi:hypothetical protein